MSAVRSARGLRLPLLGLLGGLVLFVDGTIGWALVGVAVTKLLSPPIVD